MLRPLTAPPPRPSLYMTLLRALPSGHSAVAQRDRVPAPRSPPRGRSGISAAQSRGKAQNSPPRPVLVYFVKALNLPTNPPSPSPSWGRPGPPTPPPSRRPVEAGWPGRLRHSSVGPTSFCCPRDPACTVRFCFFFGGLVLFVCRRCFVWFCFSNLGLMF